MNSAWDTVHTIPLRTGTLTMDGPAIMGVLNVTPDSFSDGGTHNEPAAAIAHGLALIVDGAHLIDIGGESTRPGSSRVPTSEEISRVVPVIEALSDAGHIVSIDTRNAETARAAIHAGAHIINDISGFRDAAMRDVVAETGCAAIVMHMQGEPNTMQDNPTYSDVVAEVHDYLAHQTKVLMALGAASVIVDPGMGFGKRAHHNVALLRAVPQFAEIAPVLIGASRKSFLNQLFAVPDPANRLPGTLATHAYAAHHGAAVIRAHDVREHAQYFAIRRALEVPNER